MDRTFDSNSKPLVYRSSNSNPQPVVQYVDYGVNPQDPFKRRPNRELQTLDSITDLFIKAMCCLTAPFSLLCSCYKVSYMNDLVTMHCGVVDGVYSEGGCLFLNPCCLTTETIYMGIRDIEINKMAANDSHGSPIECSAQFAYRISDQSRALYAVADLSRFLKDQGISTLRAIMAQYPYDVDHAEQECLRRHSEHIEIRLKEVLQTLVSFVGVHVEFFRINNVCFEKSMEKMLLARQEAQAEVTARTTIAEGAAGIVQETLKRLMALGIKLSVAESNRLATNLTLMIVNHGHTTINLFEETIDSRNGMPMPISHTK